MLIVNADDWGMQVVATDAAIACYRRGRITSTSAMVFMVDSERGAQLALECGIDVGLHLNFTTPFTGCVTADSRLSDHQARLRRFLCRSRYALLIYNPLLGESFRYVYRKQQDEFYKLYGKAPSHIDGHQHMHLCSNMLLDGIVPRGERVRRSFSFWPGEKIAINRFYRRLVDRRLGARYRLTDYFFALSQNLSADRFGRVVNLAQTGRVELMTHPANPLETSMLMGDDYGSEIQAVRMGPFVVS